MDKECSVNWCKRWWKIKKWYCNMHYKRFLKHGDAWQLLTYVTTWVKCLAEWCYKYGNLKKWYCIKHYRRIQAHWDYNITKTKIWEDRIKNPLYKLYLGIKKRCYNKNASDYQRYWWRWIIMCDRRLWIDWFTNFSQDMWERPDWYSIDRIDNDWDYEPHNCKRSSKHEQQYNRRNNNKTVWVHHNKSKWTRLAYMFVNKVAVLSKTFKQEEEAIKARKEAEIKYLWKTLQDNI